MRVMRTMAAAVLLAGLGLGAADSEAKRLGAGANKGSAGTAKPADKEANTGGVTVAPRFRSGVAGPAAGTVVGAAAGGAAARALADDKEDAPPPDKAAAAEQERQDKLAEQERKAQAEADARRTEEAVAAAEMRWKADQAARAAAERRRQEAVEARQRAAEERQAEEKRLALAREKSCIIKPAMSDAEIAHCKWAWSFPPPAP